MKIRAWAGAALMVFAAQAFAGDVAVTEASARATAPGQDTAAVAMHIKAAKDGKLVAVSSPAAQRVEIHIMKHANGMMEMRAVDSLPLPANQEVILGSGSHLMLVGLKHPLKAGARVGLTLTVEFADRRKEQVKVEAAVTPIGRGGGMDMPGMEGGDMGDMEGHEMGDHTH
jgi:periplasmic copper chaperone A